MFPEGRFNIGGSGAAPARAVRATFANFRVGAVGTGLNILRFSFPN
jgi:hypothetical protein